MREIARACQGFFPTQDRIVRTVAGLLIRPPVQQSGSIVVLDAGCGKASHLDDSLKGWILFRDFSFAVLFAMSSGTSHQGTAAPFSPAFTQQLAFFALAGLVEMALGTRSSLQVRKRTPTLERLNKAQNHSPSGFPKLLVRRFLPIYEEILGRPINPTTFPEFFRGQGAVRLAGTGTGVLGSPSSFWDHVGEKGQS